MHTARTAHRRLRTTSFVAIALALATACGRTGLEFDLDRTSTKTDAAADEPVPTADASTDHRKQPGTTDASPDRRPLDAAPTDSPGDVVPETQPDAPADVAIDVPADAPADTLTESPPDVTADAPADAIVDAPRDAHCTSVTYDPPVPYATGCFVTTLTIGDATGDGVPDLVVTDILYSGGPDSVSILKNLGQRAFAPESSHTAGLYIEGIAIADFNGDGIPDVAASDDQNSTVGVLINAGGGTLLPPATYRVGNTGDSGNTDAYSVAAGDLDGDGRPDIVVGEQDLFAADGSGAVGVLINQGAGILGPEHSYPNTVIPGQMGGTYTRGPVSIALADLNGDGHLDIAVASTDEHVAVYLNNGDGTFAPEKQYSIGGQGQSGNESVKIAIGDLDGDGRPDLAVTNAFGPSVGILLNIGGGDFAPETPLIADQSLGFLYQYLAVTDLDNDGREDLVTSSFHGADPGISTFTNLGGATFAPPATYPLNVSGSSDALIEAMAVGDLDGDGLPDIALAAEGVETCQVEVFYARCR